eukprot:3822284-Amphidinium_carterae.2
MDGAPRDIGRKYSCHIVKEMLKRGDTSKKRMALSTREPYTEEQKRTWCKMRCFIIGNPAASKIVSSTLLQLPIQRTCAAARAEHHVEFPLAGSTGGLDECV